MSATPNVPLLRKTLAHIEAHPEEWDQTSWHCGSAGCYAFHAINLSGEPVKWTHPGSLFMPYLAPNRMDRPDDVRDPAGVHEGVHVKFRARRVLGLTDDQANELFDEENDLDALRRMVAAFETSEAGR